MRTRMGAGHYEDEVEHAGQQQQSKNHDKKIRLAE